MMGNYQLSSSLKNNLNEIATQDKGFSDIVARSEEISRTILKTIVGEESSMGYFNITIEYERQILIGLTFVKGNIDRYGTKFIGFDNISKLFSGGTQFLLTLAIVIAACSLIGIGYIVFKQRPT